MVPVFFSRVWGPAQKGGEIKWGNNCHPRTGLSAPSWICTPRKGDKRHASLDMTGNNLLVLCPTLQLASLTWWTRHRKAPAIDLKDYKSGAAQTNPANGESDLVENADSGDKQEAGRNTRNKHSHAPVSAQPRSHASPSKAHGRPSVTFTGIGAWFYGIPVIWM